MRSTTRFVRPIRIIAALVLALGFAFAEARTVQAATITVTTTDDELNSDGDCSLREAIQAANLDTAFGACAAGSGNDTIDVPAGTYILTFPEDGDGSVDLDITSVLVLRGAGSAKTIIDADDADTVVDVQAGANATLTHVALVRGGIDSGVRNGGTLTLRNALVEADGAGIDNRGTLTVRDSTVQKSRPGILNTGSASLRSTTVRENSTSPHGAGILNRGTLAVARSTIADNYGDAGGGGIANYGTAVINDRSIVRGNSSDGESDASGGGVYNTGSLTIDNATLSGNGADFGGALFNTASGTVTINRSYLSENGSGSDGRAIGGAIANFGTVIITDTTLYGNRNSYGSGWGGAIYNGGAMTLTRSTVSGNRSLSQFEGEEGGYGGAIANGFIRISDRDEPGLPGGARLTLTNSTISGNRADVDGGGIFNQADSGPSTIWLNNVTIADNIADNDANGSGDGGGVFNGPYDSDHRLRMRNTLLGNNSDRGGQAPVCTGEISSYGYNLVRSITGCTIRNITTGNIVGADPRLGPLRTNGGPTKTHALLSGRPAVDKANPSTPGSSEDACPVTDQRHYRRPTDGDFSGGARCDIGAFERRSSPVPLAAAQTPADAAPTDDLPLYDSPPASDAPPQAVAAAGTLIVVTTTADELTSNGQCSLREAIRAANWDLGGGDCPAGNGADTISLPPGTYTLAIAGPDENVNRTGDLDIVHRLSITGGGTDHVSIDGAGVERIFEFRRGSRGAIDGVTVREAGGEAITNAGELSVTNSFIHNNQGSGIGGASGALTVSTTTIRDNRGFGIAVDGTLTIANSRLVGNQQRGVYIGNGTATVRDSTIERNRDGGLQSNSATLTIANTTVRDNR